jgi:hypothetical protein
MDIKYFALQDWVESDLILLHEISSSDNTSDAFTKILSKQLFYRHYDTYMGRCLPDFWRSIIAHLAPLENTNTQTDDFSYAQHTRTIEHGEGNVGTT